MKFKLIIVLSAALITITSCAKRPNAIVPVDVSSATYQNYTCEQLALEQSKEQTKLTALSAKQTSAANADAFGVFLVGVPVGSLAGTDVEGQIAISKGRIVSMENVAISKQCNAEPEPNPS